LAVGALACGVAAATRPLAPLLVAQTSTPSDTPVHAADVSAAGGGVDPASVFWVDYPGACLAQLLVLGACPQRGCAAIVPIAGGSYGPVQAMLL
jgi:hypothetical protein